MNRFFFCLLLAMLFAQNAFAQTTYQVGPNRTYTKPSQVITLVQTGDIVEIDAGEYIGDVAAWYANNITIKGIGGMVHLKANGQSSQGKAIWVIAGDNYTIENIEFSDCKVPDQNGAGIRHEGTNLNISRCYFHDNETGILTTNNPNSTLFIEYSEFARNSHPNGYAHNIYINNIRRFILRFSYFHGAVTGHNVKSRAKESYILYNRIMDESDGASSYLIDLPNGGKTYIVGNLIQQGQQAPNNSMIAYAMENVAPHAINELNVYNNTILNERGNGYFFNKRNLNPTTKIFNNLLIGNVTALANGGIDVSAEQNLYVPNVNNAGLVNPAQYDYHLTANATAINAGIESTTMNVEINPSHQYVHKANGEVRLSDCAMDMGAYEFAGATAPLMPEIMVMGLTELCPDESTMLDAGAGYTTYSWNTGSNTQKIMANAAGNYQVTVTLNGQSGTDDINVAMDSNCDEVEDTTGVVNSENVVRIKEPFGQAVANYPMQLGRPFVKGEITNYPKVLVNGEPVLTQANIKLKWEDGSVKHAILNFIIPQIAANETIELSFENQTNGHNTGALTRVQMLDARFNFDANIQISGTTNATASARQMLENNDFEYWLEGEVATTILLKDHSTNRQYDMGFDQNRSFRPVFHATFWHQLNKVEVRYIGELANTEALQPMNYNLSLSIGEHNPTTVYTQNNISHHSMSRWTKKYWVDENAPNKLSINHNIAYLASTTLFPNFDASRVIPEQIIATKYNRWITSEKDLFDNGSWTKAMGTTGGRPEIGPYPSWTVRWLFTGDWRAYEQAFGCADLAAAWPYHLREGSIGRPFNANNSPALGKPLSLYARPTFWWDKRHLDSNRNLEDNLSPLVNTSILFTNNGWIIDNAHQPDPHSPQYLLSGDYWYLEEMQFLASFGAAFVYNSTRSTPANGVIDGQVRGMGWTLRNRVHTASITPDGSPEKNYFTELTNQAIACFEGMHNITGTAFENNFYWQFAKDKYYQTDRQPNPLHYWRTKYPLTSACNAAVTTDKAWHFHFLFYGLARAEELGYPSTAIRKWLGEHIVGIRTNPDYDPFLSAISNQPMYGTDGRFFQTYGEIYNAVCPNDKQDTRANFYNLREDLEHGYANIAMAVTSFITDLPKGNDAWAFMEENAVSNPNLNNNPKWALLPRTGIEVSTSTIDRKENQATYQVQIYPNPTDGVSNIEISLPTASDIFLSVYDQTGRKVKEVVNATKQPEGTYLYQWNSSDVASGIYLWVLNGQVVGKVIVVRN